MPSNARLSQQLVYMSIITQAKELYPLAELEARIKGALLRPSRVTKLIDSYQWDNITEYTERRSRIIGTIGAVYRRIDDEPVVLKKKITTVKEDWYTLVLSTEEPVVDEDLSVITRYFSSSVVKKRWSKTMDNIRLDITFTSNSDLYQVEVEMIGKHKKRYMQPFLDYVQHIVNTLQDSPLYISRKRFDLVDEIVNMNMNNNNDGFSVARHRYQKPVTLTYTSLRTLYKHREDMMMTPKKDGQRFFIVIFNKMIYSVDVHSHIRLLSMNGTYDSAIYLILDTELVDDTYYAFDVVDKDGHLTLDQRLELIANLDLPMVKLKNYYPVPSEPTDVNRFWLNNREGSDGIIFINRRSCYMDDVWKWKPDVTVDVWMDINNKPGVYECSVNKENGSLVPIRFRDDKSKPNSERVVRTNIQEGYPLVNIWNGRGCYLMRKYHNRIKKDLLSRYIKDKTILDIGTGQGADLTKWRKANKVYCLECDDDMRKTFCERLAELKKDDIPNVELLPYGTWNVDEVCKAIPSGSIDVITMFFCLNSFTTVDEWDGLYRIIDHVRGRKCTIIAIFMDGKEIRTIGSNAYTLRKSKRNTNYKISIPDTFVSEERVEIGVTIDDYFSRHRYKVEETGLLDGKKKYPMTEVEKRLSIMYRYAVMSVI